MRSRPITLKCEVITPMFLTGADGTTPELRPPSIKGALRFWWRALNGHLPLEELKKREGKIFGDTQNRSKITISVKELDVNRGKHKAIMHKRYVLPCILPQSKFEVTFSVPVVVKGETWGTEKTSQLFELVSLLGGLGKRVRRGMGSVDIIHSTGKYWTKKEASIQHIFDLIGAFTNHYIMKDEVIYNNFSGGMQYFPWIRQIEMGEHNPHILQEISDTTHELHASSSSDVYEASLGHANRGRFASPIYVSVAKGLKAVVTSLNTIPDRSGRDISLSLQEKFRNKILDQ